MGNTAEALASIGIETDVAFVTQQYNVINISPHWISTHFPLFQLNFP